MLWNSAAPHPRRLCESFPRLCPATSVAHRLASVEHWVVTRQIIKTCPEAILSTDRLQEGAENMFDSVSRGSRQESESMEGEIVKVGEEVRVAVTGPLS
jgi:hypothetical protein